ncbi:HER081Wp [Eremothecium sinecaudum]|uniref:HER081Wp n=1 Tax=Eremothecium sinecaudum TaxID=45286 RepID=A0A120K2F6_9SACH|nr:HER081Wp [Eremothecium sinecaudum]AMD21360.1 HER081Wp [Eremothecium sinecaudum]
MGIPLTLYTDEQLILNCKQTSDYLGGLSRQQDANTFIDENVVNDRWTLRRTASAANRNYSVSTGSFHMGSYWCAWNDIGNSCVIGNGATLPRVVQLAGLDVAREQPSCVVMLSDTELAYGTDHGKLVCTNIESGNVSEEIQLSNNPICRIWDDCNGGIVAMALAEATIYHFRRDRAFSVSHYRLQMNTEVTCADLSHDRQYLCVADDHRLYFFRWEARATPFRTLEVCQLGNLEHITRISWDPVDRQVLVVTNRRLLCYDVRDHVLSVVTGQPHNVVEWSPMGKLFVLGNYQYSTLLHLFEYTSCGSWSSLGFTDITTRFGVRDVQHMAVLKTQLYLLRGDYCASYCID